MDSSPPGSSVCGIFQARVLEWVALEQIPSPRDLPDLGIEPMSPASPALAGRFFTTEPPGKPSCSYIDSISPSSVNFIAVESGLLCPPNLPGQMVAAGRLGEGWVTALIFRAVLKLCLVRFLHPSLGLCSRSQALPLLSALRAKPRGLWVPKKHSPASLTQTDVSAQMFHTGMLTLETSASTAKDTFLFCSQTSWSGVAIATTTALLPGADSCGKEQGRWSKTYQCPSHLTR